MSATSKQCPVCRGWNCRKDKCLNQIDLPFETPATLSAALEYAERGWEVFPAPPGEKKSYKSAEHSNGKAWGKTKDPDTIRQDWTRWPSANIGIPTGIDNGFWVLEAEHRGGARR
jgi:hypothetical protein